MKTITHNGLKNTEFKKVKKQLENVSKYIDQSIKGRGHLGDVMATLATCQSLIGLQIDTLKEEFEKQKEGYRENLKRKI